MRTPCSRPISAARRNPSRGPASTICPGALSLATQTPGQIVLAGPREGLRRAAEIGRERGVRTLALDVTGAFHSPWMAAAQTPFREALERVELAEPSVTVFCGMTAQPFTDVRDELAAALTAPVRWRETMAALAAFGARTFIDVGPDQVLARLVARNVEGAEAIALEVLAA